jgi:pseudaminic acid synthase
MNIGPLKVGPGEPCAIIAELGNAHNGSFDRAIRLLDAAKACGASAGKLQTYTPQELVDLRGDGPAPEPWGSDGWTMRTLYGRAQTPLSWLPDLFGYARHIGLPLFSSVFGPDSLAALEAVGNPAYKIARLDNQSIDLFGAVRMTGKPWIVSAAPGQVVPRGNVLLCPVGYPQTDVRLGWYDFNEYADDHMGLGHDAPYIGFSYHGTDPRVCVTAVTLGAKIIEAHFMLDAEPSELESNVSLGETAFRRMVDDVRATEVLLGC